MTDSRWLYLKKYQGSSKNEIREVENDLKAMGFESPIDALNWFVDEFEKGNADRIYGCGPCCNDFIFPFIQKVENLSHTDINNVVSSRFDSLTLSEKYSIIASYNWFFITQYSDEGRDKIKRLEELLSHTDFFRKIKANRIASENAAKIERIKNSHLHNFITQEADLIQKIHECQQEILKYQSEITALEHRVINTRRAKEREWELYQFEKMNLDDQLNFFKNQGRPLAYYEGRLSRLIDEYDFSLLPNELFDELLAASKSAKPSKLPQVFKLHKILKQMHRNNS